jgi:hypothetical protein
VVLLPLKFVTSELFEARVVKRVKW